MLIDTLKMLVMAGKDALRTTCGLPVTQESITQIRHGHLTFPSLGELGFSGGTLQRIHLGCDAMLCSHLAEKADKSDTHSGLEVLANQFLANVLAEMSTRLPKGWIENIEVGPLSLHSRGNRSFGFRMETEIGQLYLMAEVPSKVELETARDSGYLESMLKSYMPRDWATIAAIKSKADIDNLLVLLRKTEMDLQVEVPNDDGSSTFHTGIMLQPTTVGGQRAFRLSLDVSSPEGNKLKYGDEVRIRVGVQDRAFTFNSKFLGEGKFPISGQATINCVDLSLPNILQAEQRRRAFRIPTAERIPVEIECIDLADDSSPWAMDHDVSVEVVKGRLADLSFSGARIIADLDRMTSSIKSDSRVACRLFFPGEPEAFLVKGIIRRATISLADRDKQQDEVGLEFLVSEADDRLALEHIRQYVLSQQRSWLSQRVHVAGVDQW